MNREDYRYLGKCTGEKLLLLNILGDHTVGSAIDGELDRRAIIGMKEETTRIVSNYGNHIELSFSLISQLKLLRIQASRPSKVAILPLFALFPRLNYWSSFGPSPLQLHLPLTISLTILFFEQPLPESDLISEKAFGCYSSTRRYSLHAKENLNFVLSSNMFLLALVIYNILGVTVWTGKEVRTADINPRFCNGWMLLP